MVNLFIFFKVVLFKTVITITFLLFSLFFVFFLLLSDLVQFLLLLFVLDIRRLPFQLEDTILVDLESFVVVAIGFSVSQVSNLQHQ